MKIIDRQVLDDIYEQADESHRKRKHRNYHAHYEEKVQRLINLIHKESYIRPHLHKDPTKFEVFVLLRGKVAVIEFDPEGTIRNKVTLDHSKGNHAVELAPLSIHTIVSLEDGSAVYEIKQGPYEPEDDKGSFSWAPEEGSPEAAAYLEDLRERVQEDAR